MYKKYLVPFSEWWKNITNRDLFWLIYFGLVTMPVLLLLFNPPLAAIISLGFIALSVLGVIITIVTHRIYMHERYGDPFWR